MPAQRPSLLKATAPWFVGSLVASAAFIAIGIGGNPVGLVIIGLAPWIFWLGPLHGAWRARQALDRFAEEVHGVPEASSPILGYPTLRWPAHGLEVEGRFRGPVALGLSVRVDGEEGVARVDTTGPARSHEPPSRGGSSGSEEARSRSSRAVQAKEPAGQ